MADPILVTATATFHTLDDDKDDDTVLSIGIVLPNGTLVASVGGITGRFPDNRDNGPFGLTVLGKRKRSELSGALAALHIEPNGDDTWRFNWGMVLAFDDGSQHAAGWSGPFLSDEVKDRSYALDVKPFNFKPHKFEKVSDKIRQSS